MEIAETYPITLFYFIFKHVSIFAGVYADAVLDQKNELQIRISWVFSPVP